MSKKIILGSSSITILKEVEWNLTDTDYEIVPANDIDDFRQSMKSQNPDLLIIDRDMQEGNGVSLCNEIKSDEAFAQVPLIILVKKTEDGGDEHVESLEKECKADKVLGVPLESSKLLSTVQYFIAKQSAASDPLTRDLSKTAGPKAAEPAGAEAKHVASEPSAPEMPSLDIEVPEDQGETPPELFAGLENVLEGIEISPVEETPQEAMPAGPDTAEPSGADARHAAPEPLAPEMPPLDAGVPEGQGESPELFAGLENVLEGIEISPVEEPSQDVTAAELAGAEAEHKAPEQPAPEMPPLDAGVPEGQGETPPELFAGLENVLEGIEISPVEETPQEAMPAGPDTAEPVGADAWHAAAPEMPPLDVGVPEVQGTASQVGPGEGDAVIHEGEGEHPALSAEEALEETIRVVEEAVKRGRYAQGQSAGVVSPQEPAKPEEKQKAAPPPEKAQAPPVDAGGAEGLSQEDVQKSVMEEFLKAVSPSDESGGRPIAVDSVSQAQPLKGEHVDTAGAPQEESAHTKPVLDPQEMETRLKGMLQEQIHTLVEQSIPELTKRLVQERMDQVISQSVPELTRNLIQEQIAKLTEQSIPELTKRLVQEQMDQVISQSVSEVARSLIQEQMGKLTDHAVPELTKRLVQEQMKQIITQAIPELTKNLFQEQMEKLTDHAVPELTKRLVQEHMKQMVTQAIPELTKNLIQEQMGRLTEQALPEMTKKLIQEKLAQVIDEKNIARIVLTEINQNQELVSRLLAAEAPNIINAVVERKVPDLAEKIIREEIEHMKQGYG